MFRRNGNKIGGQYLAFRADKRNDDTSSTYAQGACDPAEKYPDEKHVYRTSLERKKREHAGRMLPIFQAVGTAGWRKNYAREENASLRLRIFQETYAARLYLPRDTCLRPFGKADYPDAFSLSLAHS